MNIRYKFIDWTCYTLVKISMAMMLSDFLQWKIFNVSNRWDGIFSIMSLIIRVWYNIYITCVYSIDM